MRSLDLAIRNFASFKTVSYFLIFVIRENEIFLSVNRDPLVFRFVNRVRDPPCTTFFYVEISFQSLSRMTSETIWMNDSIFRVHSAVKFTAGMLRRKIIQIAVYRRRK